MDATDRILGLASRLGQAIGESDRCKALRAAEAKLKESKASQDALRAMNELVRKVRDLEARQQPVEVEDKRALRERQEQVRADVVLQELAKAEADMVELMSNVNRAIEEGMAGKADKAENG